MSKLHLPAACLAALLLTAVAGCGSGSGSASDSKWAKVDSAANSMSDLVAEAKKEGTLTVFTSTDQEEVADWSKGFTDKYGIKVKVFRQSSSEIGTTFKTQVTTHKVQADVFSTGNLDDVQSFVDDGALAKYTPATAGKFPSDDVVAGYAYPLYQATAVVGWNTETVPADVQKELEADPYEGLLDPTLKGKVIVIDPAAGGSGMAIYANLIENYGDTYGWDYLKKLAAQDPSVQTSIMAMSQQITAGTYSATIFATESQWGELAASGAPLKFAGLPTSSGSQFYQSVVTDAPHPAAARLYQEYMMTMKAQDAVSSATGGISVMNGWKDDRDFIKKLSWYTPPTTVWTGWQTDPDFTGDALDTFVQKWDDTFGQSR
ncbi:MAG: extracellular solute-binding protein [Nocardioides sp.]|uniref:ABC transporter substrate-binding protein n=1 Tax=Nocardioides sp. TaxID=35761 RepID=UPI0039E224A0